MWVAPSSWAVVEFAVVDVEGDDFRGAGEPRSDDSRRTDAACADHGDGVTAADVAGVDGGAEAGHHATAEQPGDLGLGGRVDLGALAGGDQGLLGERADAESRREFGAVGKRHLLLGVVRVEAVPRAAAEAGAAVAADGPPVQYDEVAGLDVRDTLADRLHDPGRLVTEQEGKLIVDAALAIVQVGMADTARLDLHHRLPRTRIRDRDLLDRDRRTLTRRHHTTHRLTHPPTLAASPAPVSPSGVARRSWSAIRT